MGGLVEVSFVRTQRARVEILSETEKGKVKLARDMTHFTKLN